MAVDETGCEEAALEIDDPMRVIVAEGHDAAVVDGDVGGMNFAAEDVDEAGVFEEEFRGHFAASDTEFALQISHKRTDEPRGSKHALEHGGWQSAGEWILARTTERQLS